MAPKAPKAPDLWTKIRNLLKELKRRFEPYKPLADAKQKGDEISALFDQVEATANANRLTSTNEDVNKLYAVGSKLSNHLRALADRPPQYWIEQSGANLFSYADTTEALKRLVVVRENVDGMHSASQGLSLLTKTLTAKDYADVKGVAGSLTTATAADLYARQETWQTFDTCAKHAERLRANVVAAIEVVRNLNDSLHTFLVQKNNPRRFQDAVKKHSPYFKPGDVPELQVNPWKKKPVMP